MAAFGVIPGGMKDKCCGSTAVINLKGLPLNGRPFFLL
ncbi:hypothetical protein ASZ90_018249 [hydrocarbon metagenome]|uniref:Uncharacterized protein n=1 Tax=hydrocarbon metagenome TaxID=938273 RepID=A0A0W8E7C8_9ZZZZ